MEKNSAKISLGTAICIFIIILLIGALGGIFYYYNFVKDVNNNQISSEPKNNQQIQKEEEKEEELNIDSEKETTVKTNEKKIKLGTYKVNSDEVKAKYKEEENDFWENYVYCVVTFAENNLCSIYHGYGSSNIGTYRINENKIICNTVFGRGQEGGLTYHEENVVYEFEILDENTIKLISETNLSSEERDKIPYMTEGMKYEFAENEDILVLVED